MSRKPEATRKPRERALVCGLLLPGQQEEAGGPLGELRGLLSASNVDVVGEGIVQRRVRPVPATLLGSGKVVEIKEEIRRYEPDVVAVDNDLSPAQIRNLEKAWDKRVVDRSEVILDIFASRAQTRQARLQVELAQVEYLLPRLRRMWTHLERMEGAIGARGPGETQLETDRRLLQKRVRDLKAELSVIERRRQRVVRSREQQFTVGLVGYTNAGKSTLLNRLTGAEELAADMLFATLDTRTRQWKLPDGRTVLLSDTVGFLQRLPHHLVASFHATLEETLHADLLLHVVDASHADAVHQIAAVDEVLADLSYTHRAGVLVLNKVDRVEEPLDLQLLARGREETPVHVSAVTGEGIERLTRLVSEQLDACSPLVDVHIPAADGRASHGVRELGALLEEEIHENGDQRLRVRISPGALGRIRQLSGPGVRIDVIEEPLGGIAEGEGPWDADPIRAGTPGDAEGSAGGSPTTDREPEPTD